MSLHMIKYQIHPLSKIKALELLKESNNFKKQEVLALQN